MSTVDTSIVRTRSLVLTPRRTAVALIAAAVLTNAGFTVLGSVFNYPDVLDEPSGEVLARFREHQSTVTLWFTVLALSAALFAPIAIGVGRLRADRTMRLAVRAGVAAAFVQAIGLLRWPLLVPFFARRAASSNPQTVADAESHFHNVGTILGTALGETVGYALTAAWTALVVVSLGARFAGRAFVAVGALSAVMIVAGVLSPLDLPGIDLVNFAGYVLWSGWLVWFAVRLLTSRTASTPEEYPSARFR
jgi:hypothetical protein